jgi:hypothetical protein
MPLSLGTTNSQISLFRHIADPKKISVNKLKELKAGKERAQEAASAFSNAHKSRSAGASKYSTSAYREREDVSRHGSSRRESSHRRSSTGSRERDSDEKDDGGDSEYQGNEDTHGHGHDQDDGHKDAEPKDDAGHNDDGHDDDGHDEEAQGQDDIESIKSGNDYNQTLTTFESEKSQVHHAVRAEEDREKQEFLNELKKYRGLTTREFSLQDSLTDIQFEHDRLKAPENAANVVRIMGIVLQVIVYAVQWGNNKFGPLLKLDNGENSWAMQTGESIGNHEYDGVLEKLYRKHWRKGSMSPEAELGMMLIGSAGVFHFQTHVNEKMNKKASSKDGGGSGSGGGGFNLMSMLGPIMGLMGGPKAGNQSAKPLFEPHAFPPTNEASAPSKKFDFIAGKSKSQQQSFAPPQQTPQSFAPPQQTPQSFAPPQQTPQSFAPPQQAPQTFSPPVQTSASIQALTNLEQQFAKKQQEMMDRLEQVTRRADEQMRASQARQVDLERQLQQTQMRLHYQQQQQVHFMTQQTQNSHNNLNSSKGTQALGLGHASGTTSTSQSPTQSLDNNTSGSKKSNLPLPSVTEEVCSEEEEEEEHKDVKEVMVTERQKRKSSAQLALEIDELSISL